MIGEDHLALLDALQAARGRVILSGYPSLIFNIFPGLKAGDFQEGH